MDTFFFKWRGKAGGCRFVAPESTGHEGWAALQKPAGGSTNKVEVGTRRLGPAGACQTAWTTESRLIEEAGKRVGETQLPLGHCGAGLRLHQALEV